MYTGLERAGGIFLYFNAFRGFLYHFFVHIRRSSSGFAHYFSAITAGLQGPVVYGQKTNIFLISLNNPLDTTGDYDKIFLCCPLGA
jgi:hypothetical protein